MHCRRLRRDGQHATAGMAAQALLFCKQGPGAGHVLPGCGTALLSFLLRRNNSTEQ